MDQALTQHPIFRRSECPKDSAFFRRITLSQPKRLAYQWSTHMEESLSYEETQPPNTIIGQGIMGWPELPRKLDQLIFTLWVRAIVAFTHLAPKVPFLIKRALLMHQLTLAQTEISNLRDHRFKIIKLTITQIMISLLVR